MYRSSPVYRSSPRTVIVDDAPTIVYRKTSYRTPSDTAYVNGLWTGRLEAVTFAAAGALAYQKVTKAVEDGDEPIDGGEQGVDFDTELAETRALMRHLKDERAGGTDDLVALIERPIDGVYTGESAEDDAGDQAVRTTLSFGRDGLITGHGYDEADGAYKIREGRWSKNRVAWIEEYVQGFEVALRGQVRPDGTIVALWASSRGIGGTVSLDAPDK